MHYLTVQDVLWIHFQIARRVVRFDYARLEEAVFHQYAYGTSTDLAGQAARFARGFAKKAPLETMNDATAFVATLAFLEINGWTAQVDDGDLSAFRSLLASGAGVEVLASPAPDGAHHDEPTPDIRGAIASILRRYARSIEALADSAPVGA